MGEYPHMCRDGHDEVGWRGDGELCPACLTLNARDERAKRIVEEVRAIDAHSCEVEHCDDCEARWWVDNTCDEIKRRLEAEHA